MEDSVGGDREPDSEEGLARAPASNRHGGSGIRGRSLDGGGVVEAGGRRWTSVSSPLTTSDPERTPRLRIWRSGRPCRRVYTARYHSSPGSRRTGAGDDTIRMERWGRSPS
jgi:hypothetical protein